MTPKTRTQVSKTGDSTSNDDVLLLRYNHVLQIWFNNDPVIVDALKDRGINNWYEYVRYVENLDEINSVKNRTKSDNEDDTSLPIGWIEKLLYSVSYINWLQIEAGIISEVGPVSISEIGRDKFDGYCLGRPKKSVYSDDTMKRIQAAAERDKLNNRLLLAQVEKAEADLRKAEADRDIAESRAFQTVLSTTGDSMEHAGCVDTKGVEDNPYSDDQQFGDKPYGFGHKPYGDHNSKDGYSPSEGDKPPPPHWKKRHKHKKKKDKKKRGGHGGGDGGSSGGSSSSSSSNGSFPSRITVSDHDSVGGGVGGYSGAYAKDKPRNRMKFDPSAFPEHHDQTPWTTFELKFKSILRSFNMHQLLIPTFRPISNHEEAFELDNAALYSVFLTTVKSQKGTEFVLSEALTMDGQQVWKKMKHYYSGEGSITAEHEKDRLYTQLNTPLPHDKRVRLVPTIAAWEASLTSYIIRTGKPINPADKLDMFRRYISNLSDFQNVFSLNHMVRLVVNKRADKGTAEALDPDEILNLYKQQAVIIDDNHKRSMVSRRRQITMECRAVNFNRGMYHEGGYDAYQVNFGEVLNDDLDDDQWYDVMVTKLESRKGFLPGQAHRQLTPEERLMWNKFTNESKELIMNARSSAPPSVRPPRRGNSTRRGNAFRSGAPRDPQPPVAQGATANVTEHDVEVHATNAASHDTPSSDDGYNDLASIPTDHPEVLANVHELFENIYNVNLTDIDSVERDGTNFLQQLEANRTSFDPAGRTREVNQTSEHPPFYLPRFMSQSSQQPQRVTFADDSASQTGSEAQVDIQFHDVISADGTLTQLLVPSVVVPSTVPHDVSYAGCHHLNSWQEPYVSDDRGVGDTDENDDDVCYSVNATSVSYQDDNTVTYDISQNVRRAKKGDLTDRGANGGVQGGNLRTINVIPNTWVDLSGLDNHTLEKTGIGTVGGVTITQRGPVILIFHRYALLGRGRSIHSSIQLEAYGNQVDDRSISFGGQQCIETPEGYRIPLDITDGLPYFHTRPFTDDEFATLPHVIMTSDLPWRPASLNSTISDDPTWFERQPNEPLPNEDNFNASGLFLHRDANITDGTLSSSSCNPFPFYEVPSASDFFEPDESFIPARGINEHFGFPSMTPGLLHDLDTFGDLLTGRVVSVHEVRERQRDYDALRPFFLNAPRDVVIRTLNSTTQFYHSIPQASRLFDMRRAHFPACNVIRRHEGVGTDTIFFDIEAWGGYRCCQFYIGRRSYYMSAHGMLTDGQFVGSLEDEIRYRGAMDLLISDRAQAEISARVREILRAFRIKDWQSEPHHQNQNIAERYIQELKKYANWVMNTSGAPPEAIFFIIKYAMFIHNRTARRLLGWRTPYEALTGQTPDVSMLLHFRFWQIVHIKNYRDPGTGFPSESNEIICHFLGFSETVGHSMTFLVYNPETHSILYRSSLRPQSDDDIKKSSTPPDEPQNKIHKQWSDSFPTIEEVPPSPEAEDNTPHRETTPASSDQASDRGATPNHSNTTPRGSRKEANNRGATSNTDKPSRVTTGDPDIAHLKPDDLVGRTVLLKTRDDGQRFRATIVKALEDFEGQRDSNPELVKFKCLVGDAKYEDIVSYNDMMELIEEQVQNEDGTWRFRQIKGHTKPRGSSDKPKILIEWESGEVTLEPVYNIAKKDRWIVAEYARDNGLVEEWDKIWPSLKLCHAAKNAKKLIRMINAAKRLSYKSAPVYMFGHRVPRNHDEAMELDKVNGNTKWKDSEILERDQLLEYQTFKDYGHKSKGRAPAGYKRITLHFVYAVKHDGRYKSRIVAGGHLTDAPTESVYSGVVSLRGVRFVIFLAELNGLEVFQTDVGNAYLEAYTKEKVFVIAGPEFQELEGHILVIIRALYGLKSSGLRWYERFADVLREMGFAPCPAEPEIWMRAHRKDGSIIWPDKNKNSNSVGPSATSRLPTPTNDGSYYEYIATYVDDLTIAARNAKKITDELEKKYKFKLKGTGPLKFLLGCDYFRENGVLCAAPKKYIEKMEASYERFFSKKPSRKVSSPLEKGDNPEIDDSDFLDENETKIYQSMIGSAQWVVSIGRFDVAVHLMTLSSFRAQPRRGHLDRIKRVYAYLIKMKHAVIRYRTDLPDVSDFIFPELDWSNTPYAGAVEELPTNLPPARGKSLLMTTFVDANLGHDIISGKSVTGVLHFFNKTPVDWFSKKQNTVETATFGSENTAARTAIEQIKANKLTLLQLGVPLHGIPILLGDNKSVVDSGTLPHQRLHKRHLMLSYHFVRESVASGALRFAHINGEHNPADVLSKHWGYQAVWPLLRPILFWQGDTMDMVNKKNTPSNVLDKNNGGTVES